MYLVSKVEVHPLRNEKEALTRGGDRRGDSIQRNLKEAVVRRLPGQRERKTRRKSQFKEKSQRRSEEKEKEVTAG